MKSTCAAQISLLWEKVKNKPWIDRCPVLHFWKVHRYCTDTTGMKQQNTENCLFKLDEQML